MDTDSIWTGLAVVFGVAVLLAPLWIGLLVMGRQKSVCLVHAGSGLQKNGYYGYSWTYLFFGFLVPIFRAEIGIGLLHLVFSVLTGGLFQIIMSYLYNKQYTRLAGRSATPHRWAFRHGGGSQSRKPAPSLPGSND